jgi:mannose-6-phosphate isomerase-like protein (cupin superfamily)
MALVVGPTADDTRSVDQGGSGVSGVRVIKQDELPFSEIAREFVGDDHGGAGICVIFIDAEPGRGPRLHKHPYEEVFITQEGQATMTVGDEHYEVSGGEIVIVPAGEPHKFVNSGDGPLRQIDIHVSPSFSTEWLE